MIIISLKLEELPDGNIGLEIVNRKEGTVTEKEFRFGENLNHRLCLCIPTLIGYSPMESVIANTDDQAFNYKLVAALRKRHDK